MQLKKQKRRDFLKSMLKTAAVTPAILLLNKWAWADTGAISGLLRSGTYDGMKGLADLPYFEMTGEGRLRLTVDGLERGIDGHTHLALNGLAGGEPDLLKFYPQTRYYLPPDIKSDINVYINQNADAEEVKQMSGVIIDSLTPGGSRVTETHTIPNLLAEMDLLNIDKAVIFPIRMDVPFGDNLTERFAEAITASGQQDRFILCGSVKPTLEDSLEKVETYRQAGMKGIKMHPNFARFFPNDKKAWPTYEACGKHKLPVLIHSGRTGFKEKKTFGFKLYTEDYSDIGHFEEPIAAFPETRFVLCHSGAMQNEQAIAIAKAHKNVWMDIHGQGVDRIQTMVRELGPEQLMYGSDWGFYPESIMVARLLLATEKDKTVRNMIFSENARRFWNLS